MLKCIELDERLKAMDQEITVNPVLQKVIGPLVNRSMLEGAGWCPCNSEVHGDVLVEKHFHTPGWKCV